MVGFELESDIREGNFKMFAIFAFKSHARILKVRWTNFIFITIYVHDLHLIEVVIHSRSKMRVAFALQNSVFLHNNASV